MERMWVNEAALKYPKQWIVAVNLVWDAENKVFGDIYEVTPDKSEAYRMSKELKSKGNLGKVMVMEGFNDAPQIGGLEVCPQ